MSSTEAAPGRIVPAHLDFLAIYNPSLGLSEETEKDQIVFYWSKIANDATGQACKDDDAVRVARDTANEQLRQIGLAQGIVHFARFAPQHQVVQQVLILTITEVLLRAKRSTLLTPRSIALYYSSLSLAGGS